MNTLNVKIRLLNLSQIKWTSFISNHSQQNQNLICAIFCSQAWYHIFSRQRRKSVGFAVRKSKSRELAWTTEIVQDGMLFIANTLLSINHIHILTLITTVGLTSWFLALFSSFCIVYPMIRFWIVDMKFHLYYSWMHYLYQFNSKSKKFELKTVLISYD